MAALPAHGKRMVSAWQGLGLRHRRAGLYGLPWPRYTAQNDFVAEEHHAISRRSRNWHPHLRTGARVHALPWCGAGGIPIPVPPRPSSHGQLRRASTTSTTAYLYPGNESCVGTALERLGLRDRVLLATKLPHGSCKRPEDFDRFFDEQLRRLRTERIDYYLIHNVTSPAQWERLQSLGIEDWVARQKAGGAHREHRVLVPRERGGFSRAARCLRLGFSARFSTTMRASATRRARRGSRPPRRADWPCL